MFDSKTFLAITPNLPGVYRMLNGAGHVLYVGKARDLKKRVSSYFRGSGLSPRIQLMVSQIEGIEITITRSEAEALLLENNLIKALTPRFNILFRDDKSYPYIVLTGHRYPRLGYHRGAQEKGSRYFGPFPNALAVRESIQLLQRVFMLRTCEDSVFNNRSRPCLLYQIKRCTGPCVGLISEENYLKDVNQAVLLLEGKEQQLIDQLSDAMAEAAEDMHYEEAAIYRDQLKSLSKVRAKQYVEMGAETDADIVVSTSAHGLTCVNLVMIRGGRHIGDKSFFPQNAEDQSPQEILEAFLEQHYLDKPVPPLLVLSEEVDVESLEAALGEYARHKVQIVTKPIGPRKVWVNMGLENAEQAIRQRLSTQSTQEGRLAALIQGLDLPDTTKRIECFDISHTMGEATVASCVVYENCAMQNGEYRRYNITGITPGDDFAAMKDALERRYRKVAQGEGKIPDLIMIDGGKGQLGVAKAVLEEVGLGEIPMMGVAKGPSRKPGEEDLFIAGREGAIHLPKDNGGLHLIQQIRDEAHRFAITGHRAKRGKARTQSTLEQIAGVGAKRRQKLLTQFGGLKGVMSASVDEIAKIEGIGPALAEKIYRELH